MGDRNDSTTSLTLLGRLRRNPGDQQAWNTFAGRYGTKVYAWCRRWSLQEADACDVTQNVMLELARQMASFEYRASGSFRGWLKTIAFRAWRDFLTARRRVPSNGYEVILDQLEVPDAVEDLFRRLEEERQRELFEVAMGNVRLRVTPQTWQAFVLTAIDGKSGAEVAEQLGMLVGAIWVARSRVQRFLRDEIRRLDAEDDT